MAKNSFGYTNTAALPEYQNQDCHYNVPKLPVDYTFESQELPLLYSEGFAEDRATDSSKSHRQAEKRRRDRINAQLAKLRKLIPKSEKMDKAALLEKVVDQVRDLKRKASEINKFLTIPTEIDDITIECHADNQQESQISHDKLDKNMLIKATFCCEDRPDLIAELIGALKGLNLTIIGAEMTCLGGRMKSILILYKEDIISDHSGDNNEGVICKVSAIKQSLMGVLTRMVSWSTSAPNFRVTSKRQRFFLSP